MDQLDNASEVSSKSKSSFLTRVKQKSLEDKETDAFLNEVHKKGLVMRLGRGIGRENFSMNHLARRHTRFPRILRLLHLLLPMSEK